MTFSEAYSIHGPDVEAIAKLLGIAPSEADRLINEELNRRHQERREKRKRIPLGLFQSKLSAASARAEANARYEFSKRHGEPG